MPARLVDTSTPKHAEGIALVLHGGAGRGAAAAVSPTQLSVLRMIPVAERIARAGRTKRLAVLRLLNTSRGWDSAHSPVDDVRWAIGQVHERFGAELPVALVGHSLGGRAALLSAGEPGVVSAVALAPWLYPTDGDRPLHDRRVLIVHGDQDRIARADISAAVATQLARHTEVGYVRVLGGKHAMLRRGATFDGLAAQFVAQTLAGIEPHGRLGAVLNRSHAGESVVEV